MRALFADMVQFRLPVSNSIFVSSSSASSSTSSSFGSSLNFLVLRVMVRWAWAWAWVARETASQYFRISISYFNELLKKWLEFLSRTTEIFVHCGLKGKWGRRAKHAELGRNVFDIRETKWIP